MSWMNSRRLSAEVFFMFEYKNWSCAKSNAFVENCPRGAKCVEFNFRYDRRELGGGVAVPLSLNGLVQNINFQLWLNGLLLDIIDVIVVNPQRNLQIY